MWSSTFELYPVVCSIACIQFTELVSKILEYCDNLIIMTGNSQKEPLKVTEYNFPPSRAHQKLLYLYPIFFYEWKFGETVPSSGTPPEGSKQHLTY